MNDFNIALIEKEDALIQFGKSLLKLIESLKMTPKEIANKCGVSYTHIMNLINGNKSPTVDILLLIQKGLNLTLQQIAELLLFQGTLTVIDENKHYAIQYINLEKGSAKVGWIYEERMEQIISSDEDADFYDRNDFFGSAIRYLSIYKLEPLFGKMLLEKRMKNEVNEILNPEFQQEGPLKEIVNLLIDKNVETQLFIKDFVKLYISNHNN